MQWEEYLLPLDSFRAHVWFKCFYYCYSMLRCRPFTRFIKTSVFYDILLYFWHLEPLWASWLGLGLGLKSIDFLASREAFYKEFLTCCVYTLTLACSSPVILRYSAHIWHWEPLWRHCDRPSASLGGTSASLRGPGFTVDFCIFLWPKGSPKEDARRNIGNI